MSTIIAPADQCVVMDNVSWATYEGLVAARDEGRRPRLAYDRGVLEIMSPGPRHDSLARLASHLVVALIEAWELDVTDLGSTTFKDEEWEKGFEGDACFYVRHAAGVRGKDHLDVRADPPPDVVFEVDITSSSLNKLPIYARFGVREVWRHDGERATILVLDDMRAEAGYSARSSSVVLPGLTDDALTRLLGSGRRLPLRDWLAEIRTWARSVHTDG